MTREPDVTGAWLHSYEEDTGGTAVYRPADHPFRPSRRPRRGLEFRPDGTFVELRPGPDDRPREVAGRWRARDGHVRVTFPDGRAAPFELTVLSRTADKLTIAT
ncbi:hypothetical protein Skr01_31210 [Sphaerisporangium krabiense]|uniref:Uncharacterized protein n=1 Tax=Sphaerisporangium krabiense TaxID=763782 RepID=A0A7W9DPR3_9ACTN|nr:hypothetical protein [Sphaerisporangium krabiense]MBB5625630.1 hypothetical protein [Sphaerisporangium krabiense]GII63036.1 hypothetical protein Skr01_31210 [Sphaerisporangium krabiense]